MLTKLNILHLVIVATLFASLSNAQTTPHWQELPYAPTATEELLKNDDLFFVNDTTGWVVTRSGEIFKTDDGGISWNLQYATEAFFRTIGFADSQNGWAGNLKAEEGNSLYHTSDGGETWLPVDNLPAPLPQGICGIYVADDTTVYAVGRIMGPPIFLRSRDGGASWVSFDLNTYAGMLVDVYFWNPDSGIIIGGTSDNFSLSKMVILFTADGGDSWEVRYTGGRSSEWGWKISFPLPDTGYVSIQRSSAATSSTEYFLKTTDGGTTWNEFPFFDSTYSSQAIGFVTPSVGWMGSFLADRPTLMTTDGGATWSDAGFGQNVNKIQFLSPQLGYASGRSVYKFTADSIRATIDSAHLPSSDFRLTQNFPNPFNGSTEISYYLSHYGYIGLYIFDIRGKQVARLVNVMQNAGEYRVEWTPGNIASGIYFYQLQVESAVGGHSITKKLLYLK